jgi:hypothetical protein
LKLPHKSSSQYRIKAIFSLSVHFEGTFSNFVR